MYKGSKKNGNRSRKRLSKKKFLEAKEKSKNKSKASQVKSKKNVEPEKPDGALITEKLNSEEELEIGKLKESFEKIGMEMVDVNVKEMPDIDCKYPSFLVAKKLQLSS